MSGSIFPVCVTGTLVSIKHYALDLTIMYQSIHHVVVIKAPAARDRLFLSILDHPFYLFSPFYLLSPLTLSGFKSFIKLIKHCKSNLEL